MRLNLPVNTVEYPFPPGQTLVSTTDLKGRIVYCNNAFVTVSGYTRDELLGQPHNLIRHPDMPEEAYRDLWDTIQNGKPWSAYVKNRRKDGSYYWVKANVTPLTDGQQITGFMSVRTEATREATQAAETLYAQMRAEKDSGQIKHRLANGFLIQPGLGGWLRRWTSRAAEIRLFAVLLLLVAVGCILGVWVHDLDSPELWALALGLGALATLGLTTWIHRLTVAPLLHLQAYVNRLASGDLSISLESTRTDAIGQFERALNQLCVNVRSIVRDARTEAEQMQHVTREIAAGNLELSARTESQASSLEETASSMEEITGTVRQSSESARHVAELASQASDITRQSSDAVHTVAQTMKTIADSSRRIGEINQVIDSIAFQTNILALNAAVEAARAGEQGRGFAVVASEVRALAQRTSSAAKEIRGLIETSVGQVDAGERQASEAVHTLESALNTVQHVTTLINEINDGAREQLLGISQVNEAVSQMDTITQQNAAMVEELASSATSLEQQAAAVTESVGVFKLSSGVAALPDAVSLRKAAKSRQAA